MYKNVKQMFQKFPKVLQSLLDTNQRQFEIFSWFKIFTYVVFSNPPPSVESKIFLHCSLPQCYPISSVAQISQDDP